MLLYRLNSKIASFLSPAGNRLALAFLRCAVFCSWLATTFVAILFTALCFIVLLYDGMQFAVGILRN